MERKFKIGDRIRFTGENAKNLGDFAGTVVCIDKDDYYTCHFPGFDGHDGIDRIAPLSGEPIENSLEHWWCEESKLELLN